MSSLPSMPATDNVVLQVRDLRTHFFTRWGEVKAVDGVSFDLRRGETLGIVGESGSGKSVTVLSIMKLIPSPPGKILSGEVILDGEDLALLPESDMEKVRGRKIAMILQDPMTSLNPVFNIGDQVMEAVRIHQGLRKKGLLEKAVEVLEKVRIPAAELISAIRGQDRSFPRPRALKCSRSKKSTHSSALFFLLCLKGCVCRSGTGSNRLITEV